MISWTSRRRVCPRRIDTPLRRPALLQTVENMAVDPGHDESLAAKLEALAEFSAGAGHEINNPLAVIINRTQRLLNQESNPQKQRELAAIGAQAYRVRDMIGDVMLFARPPVPEPERCDWAQAVRETAAKHAADFNEAAIDLDMDLSETQDVWADPVQLKIVTSSLLKNAGEAVGRNGRVEITLSSTLEGDKPFARLSVSDNGPGMSEVEREHLFDPFFSGRQSGRGLGFGLSKCWRIVDGHGGRIELSESLPGRTTFVVDWPQEPPTGESPHVQSHDR